MRYNDMNLDRWVLSNGRIALPILSCLEMKD